MGIFRRKVSFTRHDPLDDGLKDAIQAEQKEADAFTLRDPSGDELTEKWNAIVKDVEKDPGWFTFHED
jgi:hypothetical protein|tara:strand:+ start:1395 stop:1598 length:204 start_codon:yes stop_codon:yes gene_type:complete